MDPEADEAGKTELDSDEMSDEETKSGGKKKAKHVKVGTATACYRCSARLPRLDVGRC